MAVLPIRQIGGGLKCFRPRGNQSLEMMPQHQSAFAAERRSVQATQVPRSGQGLHQGMGCKACAAPAVYGIWIPRLNRTVSHIILHAANELAGAVKRDSLTRSLHCGACAACATACWVFLLLGHQGNMTSSAANLCSSGGSLSAGSNFASRRAQMPQTRALPVRRQLHRARAVPQLPQSEPGRQHKSQRYTASGWGGTASYSKCSCDLQRAGSIAAAALKACNVLVTAIVEFEQPAMHPRDMPNSAII